MIDFKEIDSDGENWELFSRDFLEELGFYVESSPGRGADGGKDLLIRDTMDMHYLKSVIDFKLKRVKTGIL